MKTELIIPALLHNQNKDYTLQFTEYGGETFTTDCMFCLFSVYANGYSTPLFNSNYFSKYSDSGFNLHIEDSSLPFKEDFIQFRYLVNILPVDKCKHSYMLEQAYLSNRQENKVILGARSIVRSDYKKDIFEYLNVTK